ncbi:MAG: hypothetical protein NHF97_01720 [Flavobacteriia bacterium]|nr:hypothetical protein [Candidatus Bostrichicola ureolyticus]
MIDQNLIIFASRTVIVKTVSIANNIIRYETDKLKQANLYDSVNTLF